MIIKILLIAGITGAVVFALRGSNTGANQAIRRLAGVLFALTATIGIIFPDAVTWVANLVNVGRGTDLVLYALVVAFLYVCVALYQRVHHLEQRIVELSRAVALRDAAQTHSTVDDVPPPAGAA